MLSTTECLLKADNFVVAARMAAPEERMAYLEEAAHWRRLAFQLQMERFGPFADSLAADDGDRWGQDPENGRDGPSGMAD